MSTSGWGAPWGAPWGGGTPPVDPPPDVPPPITEAPPTPSMAAPPPPPLPRWADPITPPARTRVYVTTWYSSTIVEEVDVAGDIEYSLGVCEHGEAAVPGIVGAGSAWLPASTPYLAGLLIARDDVPVWTGIITGHRQTAPTRFDLRAATLGVLLDDMPAGGPLVYRATNDHQIYRSLLSAAMQRPGQGLGIEIPQSLGASTSDREVPDDATLGDVLEQVGACEGGPEWAYVVAGTLAKPRRVLLLADRLGTAASTTRPTPALEWVHDPGLDDPAPWPTPTPLGGLFPVAASVVRRRGGNVVAHPARESVRGWSAHVALGDAVDGATVRSAVALQTDAALYPRLTRSSRYSGAVQQSTADAHARADAAAAPLGRWAWTLVTRDDDPAWGDLTEGDDVQVIIDDPVYGVQYPIVERHRVLRRSWRGTADGGGLVSWVTARG